jgi:phosphoribosylanthranilate isomerase
MALKTTVVVGNITNLSEARYCAGMGVDYLAFPAHRINPITYKEITSWVSGPSFIIDLSQVEDIISTIRQYEADYVFLAGRQIENLSILQGKKLIVRIDSIDDLANLHLEMDSAKLHFIVMNEAQIADFPREKGFSVLVSISNASSLAVVLEQNISGIWLDGSDEERPGLKDYSTLEVVLEQLEIAD